MSRISAAAFSDTKPHYDLLDGLRGVAALVAGSVALAWLCLRFYDEPVRRFLSKRLLRR